MTFVSRMMAVEVAPTVAVPVDLAGYQVRLLERFANPAIRHRTAQIAMDGSQKLPQRLLAPIRDQLRAGGPIRQLTLAVAGWLRYAAGQDEHGRPDRGRRSAGRAVRWRSAARAVGDPDRLVAGFLAIREVFGDDLPRDPRFVGELTGALRSLIERGAQATVAERAGAGANQNLTVRR